MVSRVRQQVNASVIIERDGGVCVYCHDPAEVADHFDPWIHSHSNALDNLIACCATCNSIAGSKVFDTFIEKQDYILSKRNTKKWQVRLHKKTGCIDCGKPYSQGAIGATAFLCPRCAKLQM